MKPESHSPLAMSVAEREAFLAETRVAILSIPEEGLGPFTVPIWYTYEPGGQVRIATGGSSRKGQLIRIKYVSIEGPVTIVGKPDFERDVRPLAIRYLGEQAGERYLAMTVELRADDILVVLTPERWRTVDFRKWRR